MKLLWTVPWVVLPIVVVIRLRVPYRGQAPQPLGTACPGRRAKNGAKSRIQPPRVAGSSICTNDALKTGRNTGILDWTAVARFLKMLVLSAGDGHRC
jgi:hypothetical protein